MNWVLSILVVPSGTINLDDGTFALDLSPSVGYALIGKGLSA